MLLADGLNLDLRVGLTVALQALVALLGLHLVDADLLALAVLDDVRGDDGAVDQGSAKDAAGLVGHGEDAVELNGGTGLGVELLDVDDVALRHAVLLAAGLDDGVLHVCFIPLFKRLALGAGMAA